MCSSKDKDWPRKNWYVTINNYTDDDIQALESLDSKYLIYGLGVGLQGTPHVQGYIQLKKRERLNRLKEKLPKAHVEPARGTPAKNRRYCSKEGNFKVVQRRQRPDLKGMVRKGKAPSPLVQNPSDTKLQDSHRDWSLQDYTKELEDAWEQLENTQ